ncbi:MAG: hypothetical protein J3K34DRAFT_521983 [Monoraphidium minutum]|nr:MAG: hypothetical protein J3K34DRAFT_521983 [Monoraphidium minutum]
MAAGAPRGRARPATMPVLLAALAALSALAPPAAAQTITPPNPILVADVCPLMTSFNTPDTNAQVCSFIGIFVSVIIATPTDVCITPNATGLGAQLQPPNTSAADLPKPSGSLPAPQVIKGKAPATYKASQLPKLLQKEAATYNWLWTAIRNIKSYWSCSKPFGGQVESFLIPDGWDPVGGGAAPGIYSMPQGNMSYPMMAILKRKTAPPPGAKKALPGHIAVLVRGTNTNYEWRLDMQYDRVQWKDAAGAARAFTGEAFAGNSFSGKNWVGETHRGFTEIFDALWPGLQAALKAEVVSVDKKLAPKTVTFGGHSLGGAVAPMLALAAKYYLKANKRSSVAVNVVTFGAPSFANSAFAKDFSKNVPATRRVVFENDFFTKVPCNSSASSAPMPACATGTPVPSPNPDGTVYWRDYAFLNGAVLFKAADMPAQQSNWDGTKDIYWADPAKFRATTYATHVCSYNCYLWKYSQREPGGNNMCSITGPLDERGAPGAAGGQAAATCDGVAARPGCDSPPSALPPPSGGGATSAPLGLITKVHALQLELSMLPRQPLLAAPAAAEVLRLHLHADFVGICVFVDDEPDCAVLIAASGPDAPGVERHTVMRGVEWSAARLLAPPGAAAGRVYVPDAECPQAELPRDFAALHRGAGLRCFAAEPIGRAGRPLGALVLGKRAPRGFEDAWDPCWLSAAATSLLQHVRSEHVTRAARALRDVDAAPDPASAISQLLQARACGSSFMLRATNLPMGLRLALIRGGGGGGEGERALLFEPAAARRGWQPPSGSGGGGGAGPLADLTVRELSMSNTLLESAVSQKKARFVKDCASYMQNCPTPARDVFTHAAETVASLVVVPLLVGGAALGAVYFTLDKPCDFANIQEALLGFVHCMAPVLHCKLMGQMDGLRARVSEAQSCLASGPLPPLPEPPRGQSISDAASVDAEGSAGGASCANNSIEGSSDAPPARPRAPGHRLSAVSGRRLCTEAMLKVLQQEIRKGRRRSAEVMLAADLVVLDAIGAGGYGSVMNARRSDSEAVGDAMEMAVLSSVSHPNIVQVYSCLTDMVQADDGDLIDSAASCPSLRGSAAGGRTRYRRALPGEDLDSGAAASNIIVMEFCDRGTLRDAVEAGMFHRRLAGGAVGVDLGVVLDVLLDIAFSLQYLHRAHVLHGDVKLANVLLKSEPSRVLGVTPKLADFGLARILKESGRVINISGAGTVTHLAPEMFTAGSQLTTAVDAYAFGVLIWELYTGGRPFQGLSRDGVIDAVLLRGARPRLPTATPRPLAALAAACWAASPADRPNFDEIAAELQQMSSALHAQSDAAAAPAPTPAPAPAPAAAGPAAGPRSATRIKPDGARADAPPTPGAVLAQRSGGAYTTALVLGASQIVDWDLHLERLAGNLECLNRERGGCFEPFLAWCRGQGAAPQEAVRRLVEPQVAAALGLMAAPDARGGQGQGQQQREQQQQQRRQQQQEPEQQGEPGSAGGNLMLVVALTEEPPPPPPPPPDGPTGATTGGGGGAATSSGEAGPGSGGGGSSSRAPAVAGTRAPLSVAVYVKRMEPAAAAELDTAVMVMARGAPRQWAHAKHCAWVLQRRPLEAARPPGAAEVILVDGDGGLVEGLVTNFYVIAEVGPSSGGGGGGADDGTPGAAPDLTRLELQTATGPRQAALPGTAQRRVLEAAAALGIRVRADAPRARDKGAWREAFISNSIKGLQAVGTVAYWPDGPVPEWELQLPGSRGGGAGAVTRLLREKVAQLQRVTHASLMLGGGGERGAGGGAEGGGQGGA